MSDNISSKRRRKLLRKQLKQESMQQANTSEQKPMVFEVKLRHLPKHQSNLSGAKGFYEANYKKLLIIPIVLLILSIIIIGAKVVTTGDFVNRGITLKGGTTITFDNAPDADILELLQSLGAEFPQFENNVRELSRTGKQVGVIIDSEATDTEDVNAMIDFVSQKLPDEQREYSVETMGSALGASFFKEIFRALYIAFLFMGAIVFFYFGKGTKYKIIVSLLVIIAAALLMTGNSITTEIIAYLIGLAVIIIYIRISIPSVAVILAAFSDIVVTLAIVNVLGIKLSTAGIAAFLMIIGYSVDTDILLSTKLLKRKEGSVINRLFGAMKTGLTMSLTTIGAVTVALIFSESDVIRQIMTILLIGLVVDLINTWILNAGILRIFLDKKKTENE